MNKIRTDIDTKGTNLNLKLNAHWQVMIKNLKKLLLNAREIPFAHGCAHGTRDGRRRRMELEYRLGLGPRAARLQRRGPHSLSRADATTA